MIIMVNTGCDLLEWPLSPRIASVRSQAANTAWTVASVRSPLASSLSATAAWLAAAQLSSRQVKVKSLPPRCQSLRA